MMSTGKGSIFLIARDVALKVRNVRFRNAASSFGRIKFVFVMNAAVSRATTWGRLTRGIKSITIRVSSKISPLSRSIRLPLLGLLSGFIAGNASGLLGIGGGIINVPVMTLGMRVPITVATGTSALVIGLTTTVAAVIYYANGFVQPLLVAIVLEAVFAGALLGPRIQDKIRNDALKAIFAAVLIVLATLMLLKGQI